MASGIVRFAIVSALDDADFDIDTDKARFTKELAADLLDAIMKTDDNIECFDRFAEILLSNFKEIIQKDHRKTKKESKDGVPPTLHWKIETYLDQFPLYNGPTTKSMHW